MRRSLGTALILIAGLVVAAPVPAGAAPAAAAADPPLSAAEKPPLGWNSWNTFACDIDEQLIRDTADLMVSSGMAAAGYQYVNLDDCWAEKERDSATGRYVPHHERFPSGIKALADYVHAKGLKLGIYTSAGTETCARTMPGSLGHEELDAQTFAEWEVDYLKYDNCHNQGVPAIERYKAMGDALKKTGRHIIYSICEWGQNDPWLWGASVGGNLWRTTGDINDSWSSVMSILDQQVGLEAYSKLGAWNDPDMLEVGNPGLTRSESRAHMSLWSLLNAPLLAGNDLRIMTAHTRLLLTDPDVLAVNQDWGGRQGAKLRDDGQFEVWSKPMSDDSVAVLLLNRSSGGQTIGTSAAELGLPASRHGYAVKNVWTNATNSSAGRIRAHVPSHDVAMFVVRPARTADLPPLVTVEAGTAKPYLEDASAVDVSVRLHNDGTSAVRRVRLGLTAPDGWTAAPRGSGQIDTVQPGRSGTVRWRLSADQPDLGPVDLAVTGSWLWRDTAFFGTGAGRFTLVTPPPSGQPQVSDLGWLYAENGWGPAERNTSNGERASGDGKPITIAGTVYPKGIGAHAPGVIGIYLGKHCTRFAVTVGIDDEVGDRGQAGFEVWADGVRKATAEASGAGPAVPLGADVTGADLLELRLDTLGDASYDHADWATPTVTCT